MVERACVSGSEVVECNFLLFNKYCMIGGYGKQVDIVYREQGVERHLSLSLERTHLSCFAIDNYKFC